MADINSKLPGIVVTGNIYLALKDYAKQEWVNEISKFQSMHEDIKKMGYKPRKLIVKEVGSNPRCNISFLPTESVRTGTVDEHSEVMYFSYTKPSSLYKLDIEWIYYFYEEHLRKYSRIFFDSKKELLPEPGDNVGLKELINFVSVKVTGNERKYIFRGSAPDLYAITIEAKKLFLDKISVRTAKPTHLVLACQRICESPLPEGQLKFQPSPQLELFNNGILKALEIRKGIFKK